MGNARKTERVSQPRAIGYVRVSTQYQVEDGVSLEAQRSRIKAWCDANGYALVAVYEDAGISGARADNRAGLQEALSAAGAGFALVTYSISRLARSTKDMLDIAERLERRGADLVSLTERIDTTSAAGRMVFRMLAVLGEFERDLVGERTSAALRHKRACGEVYGTVPFGFEERDGKLVPVEKETRVVEEVCRLRRRGASFQKIADRLNKRGVAGKQGGKWHASTVRYLLFRQENRPADMQRRAS